MKSLRRHTGKGYQAILDDYKNKHAINERLKADNSKLEKERREHKNQLQQEMRDNKATLETLKWFTDTREALRKNDVEIEELDKLCILMLNVSERSFDPEDVTAFYYRTRN